ncbi:MAG: hypothetical protein NDF53_01565 [archaeon GB-1867-097]|nr:hypothetical protein [Candidatus Culexmicrobium thermophilum]MCS7384406.1 hypothetical protein [Candidatus Culexmicrobium thermophilum]RLE55943.1 MAG: hypothetical protein DRJ30_03065 [Candidatus Verstraetearchaeota archaeon]HDO19898.1 hypothetical protein [Candidatus Bathyarchaeota archaeon]
MSEDKRKLKEMAEMLRKGATMLNQICPECKVPLFRLKDGTVICPSCKRKVLFVSEDDASQLPIMAKLKLEEALSAKIVMLADKINNTMDLDELCKLAETASVILNLMDELKSRKGK